MKNHARIVVIGGGVAGCSTLCRPRRESATDVVLVERDELTFGITWQSAAQVTQFGAIQVTVGLKRHSVRLYQELAGDPDFPIDYHITGGIRLAHDQGHRDGYRHFTGMAKTMGVDYEVINAAECGLATISRLAEAPFRLLSAARANGMTGAGCSSMRRMTASRSSTSPPRINASPLPVRNRGTCSPIAILGSRYPAEVLEAPAYDPDNLRPRS